MPGVDSGRDMLTDDIGSAGPYRENAIGKCDEQSPVERLCAMIMEVDDAAWVYSPLDDFICTFRYHNIILALGIFGTLLTLGIFGTLLFIYADDCSLRVNGYKVRRRVRLPWRLNRALGRKVRNMRKLAKVRRKRERKENALRVILDQTKTLRALADNNLRLPGQLPEHGETND